MKWLSLLVLMLTLSPLLAQRGTPTNLIINTDAIVRGGDYTVEVKGNSNSYTPGSTDTLSFLGLAATDDIVITIPASGDGDPIDVVFNISGGEIINLRGQVEYDAVTYDAYFDNEEFITTDGLTITFHVTDQRNLVDNKLYLYLDGGLVFSPDGDGNYDELSLVMTETFDVTSITIETLNGTEIYATTDKTFVWDGTVDDRLIDPGVYNYSIVADGETIKGQFLVQY